MNIVVSGANGFIGRNLISCLKQMKRITLITISRNLIIKIFGNFEIDNSKIKRNFKDALLSSSQAIKKLILGKIEQ